MTALRLEIDLHKIHHNARALVEPLARRNISVTGVTKAMLGSPDIARTLLDAGTTALGDSRIEFPLVFPAAKVVLNAVRVGAARFRRRVTS